MEITGRNNNRKEDDGFRSSINFKKENLQPSMLSFAFDLPNIVSLAGLLSAFLGIYFAVIGKINFSIIGLLWAVLFDWLDGLVASLMKGRTDAHRSFGGQLDSLIDIVSFGVLPAVILTSYMGFSVWTIPIGFFLVAACAIRLSYFNVYGLSDGKSYTGLAVDYNGLFLALLFVFEGFLQQKLFGITLAGLMVILALLNLSSIKIPKFSKIWIIGIATYVISLTIYLWN